MSKPNQHLFAEMQTRVAAACRALSLPPTLDLSRVVVEPPKDPTHGDMATNAAMVLSKDAGLKPRDLAEKLAAELRRDPLIEKVEIAGPGFINLTLKVTAWHDALRAALGEGAQFGASGVGARER